MIVPDANLLLYAYDSESPSVQQARQWRAGCLNETTPAGLTHPVVFAYLRVSTNRRVFRHPLSLDEGAEEVAAWYSRRVAVTLLPDRRHHESVIALLRASGSAEAGCTTPI